MATQRQEKRSDDRDETKISGSPRRTDATVTAATSVGGDTLSENTSKILPSLCRPDKNEAENYYRGLPTCPRLIGRTSSGIRRWTMPIYDDEDTIDTGYPQALALRQATPIGGPHPALQTIEGILSEIKEALGALPWTCMDLLRIGLDTMPMEERPVVLWIGLRPNPYAWEEIARALRAVHCILDGAGLDMECEFREADVVLLQNPSPPLFQPVLDEQYRSEAAIKRPMSTSLGQEIFPANPKTIMGTLGIYVCQATRVADPPIWGLTCRHVGLPLDTYPNTPYGPRSKAQRQPTMHCPSDRVLHSATQTIQYIVEDEKQRTQDGAANDCEVRARKTLAVFQQMRALANRAIGSVFLSPPLAAMPGQREDRPWTRDWALIDLQANKFPRAYTRNEVDLRDRSWAIEMGNMRVYLEEHVSLPPTSFLPWNGLLKLSGIIPLVELEWLCSGRADREPPYWLTDATTPNSEARDLAALHKAPRMVDRSQSRVLLVGKRGAVSNLTWGTVSEFRSVVRYCHEDIVFESRELAVIGLPGELGIQTAFSKQGDSGAIVFNVTGRVVALLTGGPITPYGQADVTYCTPFELILQDICKEAGEEVRLL